jgi:hypothetical protein
MNPFFVFLGFIALLAVALVWFAHRADLGATLAEHAKIYARSYAKGAALVTISVFIAFDESFRNLTPEAAAAMSWWQWSSLFIKPTVAGLSVFVAFLDRSVAEAQAAPPRAEPPPVVVPPARAQPFETLP